MTLIDYLRLGLPIGEIYNHSIVGYRNDKPDMVGIHDYVSLGKAKMNANAALLYAGKNPRLAEYFLDQMEFDADFIEKRDRLLGKTKIGVENVASQAIRELHQRYSKQIRHFWQQPMMTDQEANEELLKDLIEANPKEAELLQELLGFTSTSTIIDLNLGL